MKSIFPLIGVIHLPPLPGSPGASNLHPAEALDQSGLRAIKEAKIFEQAGFFGLILENFGDRPFFKTQVPPETTASLAIVAAALRHATRLPLGINVLRNDAFSALAIAAVTGCDFIRVNVLSGVVASDQGLIEGDAAKLLRERERLRAPVSLFVDALVKHSEPLSTKNVELVIEELALRSLGDSVIITGQTTGRAIEEEDVLRRAYQASREQNIPLYLGSGVNAKNLPKLKPYCDGVILSSALRHGGRAGAPLDPKRLKEFIKVYRSCKTKRRA